jgi:hypothetical protein
MERPSRPKRRKRDKDYPKRKLSAYNLFFRDERKVILKEKGHPIIAEQQDDYNYYENNDGDHGSEDDNDEDDMSKKARDPRTDHVKDEDDDDGDDNLKNNNKKNDDNLKNTKQTDTDPKVHAFRSSSTSGGVRKRGDSSLASNSSTIVNDLLDMAAAASSTAISSSIPPASTGAPHHKISFQDLAKTIGTRWKALDPERLKYYQDLAAKETERFNAEMKVYQEKLKKKRMQQMQMQQEQQEQDTMVFHQQNPSSYSSYSSPSSSSFPTKTTMHHFSYPSQGTSLSQQAMMMPVGQTHKKADDNAMLKEHEWLEEIMETIQHYSHKIHSQRISQHSMRTCRSMSFSPIPAFYPVLLVFHQIQKKIALLLY